MKNKIIIFRMTNACNLNCEYCYDKCNHITVKKENEDFSEKIPNIIKYIEEIWKEKDEKAEIIFHGGEPLVINPENYINLMEKIKEKFNKVRFSIQTNATLINEKYIEIFKKYDVHIGISLDGYDEETNKYRVYKSGRNSFKNVIEKISLLQDNNIKFGVIMTVNRTVLDNELKLYNFIKKYNLNCNIRPAFKSADNSNIDYMNEKEYYLFFTNLFNIWINDKNAEVKISQIKELKDEFIKVLEPNYCNRSCSSSECCQHNFISLDRNGNVYSCNRTYNNKKFFYGNLQKNSMQQIEEKINKLCEERKEYIRSSKCHNCILYTECYGGCPANAYSLHNKINSLDDEYCNAKIKIRMYVKEYIEKHNLNNEYKEMKENGELYIK